MNYASTTPYKMRIPEIDPYERELSTIAKRFDVIQLLSRGELCITDIYVKMRVEQAAASQWMIELKSIGIVKHRREGKRVYYSLNEDRLEQIANAISRI